MTLLQETHLNVTEHFKFQHRGQVWEGIKFYLYTKKERYGCFHFGKNV